MSTHGGSGGSWRELTAIHAGLGGSWRELDELWAGIGGNWVKIFPDGPSLNEWSDLLEADDSPSVDKRAVVLAGQWSDLLEADEILSMIKRFHFIDLLEADDDPAVTKETVAGPTDLAVQMAATGCTVELTWTDISDVEDGYKVYRRLGGVGEEYSEIADIAANSESYDDSTVAADTDYVYKVAPYVPGFEDDSNEAPITTPDPCEG